MEEETAVKPTRSLRYLVRQMLLIGCALLMAGCAGVEEAPAADLAGTRWALTSLDGDGLTEGTKITLYFEEAFPGVISIRLSEDDLWYIHEQTTVRWGVVRHGNDTTEELVTA